MEKFTHNNPEVQRALNELYAVVHSPDLKDKEKRGIAKLLKRELRSAGLLSLPFTANLKRIKEEENG